MTFAGPSRRLRPSCHADVSSAPHCLAPAALFRVADSANIQNELRLRVEYHRRAVHLHEFALREHLCNRRPVAAQHAEQFVIGDIEPVEMKNSLGGAP